MPWVPLPSCIGAYGPTTESVLLKSVDLVSKVPATLPLSRSLTLTQSEVRHSPDPFSLLESETEILCRNRRIASGLAGTTGLFCSQFHSPPAATGADRLKVRANDLSRLTCAPSQARMCTPFA